MALKHMEMPHADGPSEHPSLQVAQGQSSITLGMAHRRRDTLKGAEVVVTANLTPPEMIRGPRDLSAYSGMGLDEGQVFLSPFFPWGKAGAGGCALGAGWMQPLCFKG